MHFEPSLLLLCILLNARERNSAWNLLEPLSQRLIVLFNLFILEVFGSHVHRVPLTHWRVCNNFQVLRWVSMSDRKLVAEFNQLDLLHQFRVTLVNALASLVLNVAAGPTSELLACLN